MRNLPSGKAWSGHPSWPASRLAGVPSHASPWPLSDVALLRSTPLLASGGRSNLMPTSLFHPMRHAFLPPR
eukprot:847428-Prymnesium_polylepis.1